MVSRISCFIGLLGSKVRLTSSSSQILILCFLEYEWHLFSCSIQGSLLNAMAFQRQPNSSKVTSTSSLSTCECHISSFVNLHMPSFFQFLNADLPVKTEQEKALNVFAFNTCFVSSLSDAFSSRPTFDVLCEIFCLGFWFAVLPKKILHGAAPNSVSCQYKYSIARWANTFALLVFFASFVFVKLAISSYIPWKTHLQVCLGFSILLAPCGL